MTNIKRRRFLKLAGGTAGVAAIALAAPASIRRALAIQPTTATGTVNDVEHVVILMQENRSFDHYFGALRGVRGFGDRFPIPLEGGERVWSQSNGSRVVPPFRFDRNTMNAALIPHLPHQFADAQAAWNQGKSGQWPRYKTDASMGYYTREEAPFQYALADAFTLCDAYHCSVHGSTDPNRIMFWSGSNHDPALRNAGINGDDTNAEPANIRCLVQGDTRSGGYAYAGSAFTWDTIPDVLEREGISWKIYQDPDDNWSGLMHGGLAFRSFREAKPGSPIYEKGMSHHTIDDLRQAVLDDALPAVSWILPTQLESEHPGAPSSAARGGHFVERVLDALTANPASWSKTAFFITYDENDGLFDHVPPPAVPSYNPDGTLAGKSSIPVEGMYFAVNHPGYIESSDTVTGHVRPWGMGPRVPMMVISPWSRGGWVNSQVFDHTSIGMFLEKRFGIRLDAISAWHRMVSGDLTSAFDFRSRANATPVTLPDMAGYAAVEDRSKQFPLAAPPVFPQPVDREAGVRPSRALPYDIAVSAQARPDGHLLLEFANAGGQGVVLHVYDKSHLERIPRRYSVASGASLSDDFWHPALADDGAYDLEVFGPNGFFRSFRGNVADDVASGVAILLKHDAATGELMVRMTNAGQHTRSFAIAFNAYRDITKPVPLDVAAGGASEYAWKIDGVGNWYDVSVSGAGKAYRMAGRMENGLASVSDPAQ
jgi:phospholipase C